MALLSEKLKGSGVKINAIIKGVPSVGSGVVYVTSNSCDYNYVITAKHIFQEDSQTAFNYEDIIEIEVQYSNNGVFKRLDFLKSSEIKDGLIAFEQDLAIIVIRKNASVDFRQIFVVDKIGDEDKKFFSWAVFSANLDELNLFDLERNDHERRRLKLLDVKEYSYLKGLSGAGVFYSSKSVLYGIICKYPNEAFQNSTIDCTEIDIESVNTILKSKNRYLLDSRDSKFKKEIGSQVVDLHQAYLNDVCLDLELARRRLTMDIFDDWFHDPLRYVDLLNQEYLFKQFEKNFGDTNYKANRAEQFYVPKKKFALRLAQILPFKDRIIYLATVGVLAEKLDDAMITSVYSARFNRFSKKQLIINGVEQWKKMKYELFDCANSRDEDGHYKYKCVIEIDLLNFYDNINKRLLCEKVLRVCETTNEKNAARLLKHILFDFSDKDSGLPQNSDASALLASFYLNQVDVFMQHSSSAYYRFMDDIRIFCVDRFEARRVLQILELELRRCHLSVNSQKTEIFSFSDDDITKVGKGEKSRSEYGNAFDLELNKIAKLRNSENSLHRKEAFQLSLKLLSESLSVEDLNESEDSARKAGFALNTIALLGEGNINLYYDNSEFIKVLINAARNLQDKPWITPQVCKVINFIPTNILDSDLVDLLKLIVLNHKFNTYPYQLYQIWLLFARHKISDVELKKYAVGQIEKNDKTNYATIAAMVIYMCSVDKDFRRVVLRKFSEGFTSGYFQNRVALISMRTFSPEMISAEKIEASLEGAHEFTYKHRDKNLVFVPGSEDDEDDEQEGNFFEQIYSI